MRKISLQINDKQITAESGKTILNVCRDHGITIPSLCSHPMLKPAEKCGICAVEAEGREELIKACATGAEDGMKIQTESERIAACRIEALNRILETHPNDCLGCAKTGGNCLLQEVSYLYNVNPPTRTDMKRGTDSSSPAIIRDRDKCIDCGRCAAICEEIKKTDVPLNETDCIFCGQCVKACPTGALTEREELHIVMEALADPSKKVIFQTAPAVHNTAGEEFGLKSGADLTKKLPTALRKLGAAVFTTDFAADVTVLEEGTEFIGRLTNQGAFPMFTSCCPGWVRFLEINYPELRGHLSSCKSPQQMFGALLKSYYAEKKELDPKDIFHVSIMPCVAKKYERLLPEMKNRETGCLDTDAVLTTREAAKLMRYFNIDLAEQADSDFDDMMGIGTGAARIFAASGGVMEAALRTVVMKLTGNRIDTIDFTEVRDCEDVKEACIDINGTEVRVAVVNGIGNARKILDDVAAGKSKYRFIEVMACKGGCIGGGGSPIRGDNTMRKESIYMSDAKNPVRRSHENPQVRKLYEDFLIKPCGNKSHDLLHTLAYHSEIR